MNTKGGGKATTTIILRAVLPETRRRFVIGTHLARVRQHPFGGGVAWTRPSIVDIRDVLVRVGQDGAPLRGSNQVCRANLMTK